MKTQFPDVNLVTGGCGFIGSALVRTLVSRGGTVINVDALTYAANPQNCANVAGSPRYHFRQVDICDGRAMATILAEFRPGAVFHLAAESHVDRSIDGPGAFVRTNITGTNVLLEAATTYWTEGLKRDPSFRFLHVSTDEVFGSLGGEGVFGVDSRYDPTSPYAASKAAADHLVRAWHRTYGLPVVLTNCSNNFGPYQHPEKLIPLMILNALEGKELPVYGTGQNVRDWIYVDDHVEAMVTAIDKGAPGATYLVGARNERSNVEVVEQICDLLDDMVPDARPPGGYRSLMRFVRDRAGHDFRYAVDPSRTETELGWRPATGFHDALRSTVQWYLDNGDWAHSTNYGRARLGTARTHS